MGKDELSASRYVAFSRTVREKRHLIWHLSEEKVKRWKDNTTKCAHALFGTRLHGVISTTSKTLLIGYKIVTSPRILVGC
jgi:hypothetical protein